ncbi:MAG: hypothetical protein F6K28_08495 [Microcoleus sp. SIO2G3]|nr:hypothetical protein [Microcoleus sp. SIO2G3]
MDFNCRYTQMDADNGLLHLRAIQDFFQGDLRGLWYIAGEMVRDVTALNKMEMLPWDIWGAIPRPNEPLNDG